MPADREMPRSAAIVLGAVVALTGVAIVGVAFLAKPEGFHAPRWVVACAGAAFLFFGGWTAALYALGYDPKRSQETLPSARIQLAVLVPGLLFFAAPFHWVAFGRGPRAFSASFSLPFFAVSRRASEMPGRVMFGIGSLLIDAILAAAVIRLAREIAARKRPPAQGDRMTTPTPSDGPADSP